MDQNLSAAPAEDCEEVDTPLIRLWMLRMLVPLNGFYSCWGITGFEDAGVAERLGLVVPDWQTEEREAVRAIRAELSRLQEAAEMEIGAATVPEVLGRNVARLARLVGLRDAECRILEFAILLRVDVHLGTVADWLGSLAAKKFYRTLSVVLGVSAKDIRSALSARSALARSGLLTESAIGSARLRGKLDLISEAFATAMTEADGEPEAMLRTIVSPSAPPLLSIEHYAHIRKSLNGLRPYLAQAIAGRQAGVNILVHGTPGTGKTQLARVLAQEIGCHLFELASEDQNGDPIDGDHRLRAFKVAQSVFSNSSGVILFDEVEDILNCEYRLLHEEPALQKHKAWLNRMLEHNPVPALWVSNRVRGIDPATIRRFDMVVELPVPPKSQRERIVQEACGDMLRPASVSRIAASDTLAPAIISRAASVMRAIRSDLPEEAVAETLEHIISSTLTAQGHAPLSRTSSVQSAGYDIGCANAGVDLQGIAAGIAETREGRLCLYGPPGTGKTAFGRWLADAAGLPIHVRRASDLLSKWVGGTERNIARAFREASEEGALLLLDEVDSFLQERNQAHHAWEVTGVNEMLSQMECYEGVLVATTNLMQELDQAALRRFELKIKFGYLRADQAWALLERHCRSLGLPEPSPALTRSLGRMETLTPGDYAAVARQARIRSIRSAEDFIAALANECALKKGVSSPIGFV